jgi:nitroreductase
MIADLVRKTRSYRRFYQDERVQIETLEELIDLARLGGSARNIQPLKYLLVNEPEECAAFFPHLGWAGYLAKWSGPQEGERPAAYIVCLLDTRLSKEADCDLGIASQNILLGATERGLGGCRIASFSPALANDLELPAYLRVLLVLALGKPKEQVVIESADGGEIKYWRDDRQIHHVPKRSLAELIFRRERTGL